MGVTPASSGSRQLARLSGGYQSLTESILRQEARDAQWKAPMAPRIPDSSLPVADLNPISAPDETAHRTFQPAGTIAATVIDVVCCIASGWSGARIVFCSVISAGNHFPVSHDGNRRFHLSQDPIINDLTLLLLPFRTHRLHSAQLPLCALHRKPDPWPRRYIRSWSRLRVQQR